MLASGHGVTCVLGWSRMEAIVGAHQKSDLKRCRRLESTLSQRGTSFTIHCNRSLQMAKTSSATTILIIAAHHQFLKAAHLSSLAATNHYSWRKHLLQFPMIDHHSQLKNLSLQQSTSFAPTQPSFHRLSKLFLDEYSACLFHRYLGDYMTVLNTSMA